MVGDGKEGSGVSSSCDRPCTTVIVASGEPWEYGWLVPRLGWLYPVNVLENPPYLDQLRTATRSPAESAEIPLEPIVCVRSGFLLCVAVHARARRVVAGRVAKNPGWKLYRLQEHVRRPRFD